MQGKRKFIIALLWWVSATVGLLAGLLAGGEYVAICGLDIGLYGAANVGSHWANNGK